MLMNKVEFCLKVVVLLVRSWTYFVMCHSFASQVKAHLETPNHLSFYSFLDFRESHQDHLKAWNLLRFSLFLLILGKASAQSVRLVAFLSVFFVFCSFLQGSKSSQVYKISRIPTQTSWSHLPPMRCAWTCVPSSMSPDNFRSTSAEKQRPVYFRK